MMWLEINGFMKTKLYEKSNHFYIALSNMGVTIVKYSLLIETRAPIYEQSAKRACLELGIILM